MKERLLKMVCESDSVCAMQITVDRTEPLAERELDVDLAPPSG
jgi:hypothetical protein